MPGQPEDAYLFYEQAAFIAPEHPEVRRGLGKALLRLGATQAAGDLLAATEGDEARSQRWEFALGHSSNRNQMPSLSQLKLTLPGFPTETMRLDQPLRPDAGPVYWLGYTRRQADGLAVQQLRRNVVIGTNPGSIAVQQLRRNVVLGVAQTNVGVSAMRFGILFGPPGSYPVVTFNLYGDS